MAGVRQASFAGGEISPSMQARTDLEQYGSSARVMRNLFPTATGALLNRPGTQWVADARTFYSGPVPLKKVVRLIPFIFSDEESYVIEAGEGYFRFHQNGAPVLAGGLPVEIVTPYLATEVARLKFVQTGDVMILVHPNHAPRELRRTGVAAFSLFVFDMSLGPALFSTAAGPGLLKQDSDSDSVPNYSETDAEHPSRRWTYVVTSVTNGIESLPRIVDHSVASLSNNDNTGAIPSELVVTGDRPITVSWQHTSFNATPAGVTAYLVYRGRDGVFGYLGTTGNTGVGTNDPKQFFVDTGEEPDFTRQPPRGETPWAGGGYPAVVAFFEERLFFANSASDPGAVWASRVGDYSAFDRYVPITADGSLEFILSSRRREEVRSILGTDRLLLFTNSSLWAAGGGNAPIAPNNIYARSQSEIGSSWLDPLVAGDVALFVRTKGTGVREVSYSEEAGKVTGAELTVRASHLFLGHEIISWAYAEDPWGVVWAVRDDGRLLSLTYQREQGVWAWAQHETDNGAHVEGVCVVPETSEDGVYLLVRRSRLQGGQYRERLCVERMASRILPMDGLGQVDVKRCVFLDSSVTYDGAPTTTVTGLAHLEGRSCRVLADGNVLTLNNGYAEPAGGQLVLDEPASVITVGLDYTSDLELLDLAPAREKQKAVHRVDFEVETSRGLQVGETFDRLEEWDPREVSDGFGPPPLFTGQAQVRVSSQYRLQGRACLRQPYPLPLTVLSVTRQLDMGDD